MLASAVEVLWTARYDYQSNWGLTPHQHEYFQMIYFIAGAGSLVIDDRSFSIAPGTLLLIKPLQLHSLKASSVVKTLDMKFLVKNRRLRNSLLAAATLQEENDPGIAALFDSVRREGEQRRPLYRDLCRLYLSEILILYLRAGSRLQDEIANLSAERMSSGDWIVQQATQFIRERFAVELSIADIARAVGRSERHVRAHFKETLGLSPRRYLLQCRIQRAQELIERSNLSFKEIADQVGFKTIHHFTRAFHEIASETPGSWRRKYQDGICKDVNINRDFVNGNWTTPIGPVQ